MAIELDTVRLTLRPPTIDVHEETAALWADPEVTRHIGGRPATREEAWARLLRSLGHFAAFGFGFWVVRERATGRYVGEMGLAYFKRDVRPAPPDVPEAGWICARWAQGQGFATEAMTAALAWADATLDVPGLFCVIDPPNLPSFRVAGKLGFVETGRAEYLGAPLAVLHRARG